MTSGAENGARDGGAPAPPPGDSGEIETLPDGSVSIPVFEERLVVEKRLVVRERIIISKDVEVATERIQDEIRREHVQVDETRP